MYCRRSEENRRDFLGEDAVEDVRLGLREVMGKGCRRAKLFQMMKWIERRKEMEGQKERKRAEDE